MNDYKEYLVRDASNYETICFIIKLEDKKHWDEAKEYMNKKREENATYNYKSDQEIMEEYWQDNNINYEIVDIPNDELYL